MRTGDEDPVPPPVVAKNPQRVLVIGGGATGILTAWELARSGHQVTLAEAKALGNGASSRSAACIRQQFSTTSTVKGMIYSVRFYERWREILNQDELPIVQNGYLFLQDCNEKSPEDWQNMIKMQKEAGLSEVSWLDQEGILEMFPYLELTDIIGARWCPTDGFLKPHVVYQDGGQAAVVAGVKILQHAAVESVRKVKGRAVSCRLSNGEVVEADVFVDAANVWSHQITAMFGGEQLPLEAKRRYLYFLDGPKDGQIVEDLAAEDLQKMAMIITPRNCYCRPDNTQIMMGWAHKHEPPVIDPSFEDQDKVAEGFRHNEPTGHHLAVIKELGAYIPAFRKLGRISATTGGFYDVTPDHNPVLCYDRKVENLVHAVGFSGHGLMHAPFTALIVSELVAAGHDLPRIFLPYGLDEVDLRPYNINRDFKHSETGVL